PFPKLAPTDPIVLRHDLLSPGNLTVPRPFFLAHSAAGGPCCTQHGITILRGQRAELIDPSLAPPPRLISLPRASRRTDQPRIVPQRRESDFRKIVREMPRQLAEMLANRLQ